MLDIFVDADGCPVKEEIYRVARRYGFHTTLVANSRMRVPQDDRITLVLVKEAFDAADDWIVGRVREGDIVITADIPLASRCLEKGARALDPKGREFTGDSIGDALATRELMSYLREMGTVTGGPAPFGPKDRSRFLARLDEVIQAIKKRYGA
jgi:uncharacterized protein